MTDPTQQQREFNRRYYEWGKEEFQREIEQQFPNLGRFKDGLAWETANFMALLTASQKQHLANALLKDAHDDAIEQSGEQISVEEGLLVDGLNAFREAVELSHNLTRLENEGDHSGATDLWSAMGMEIASFLNVFPSSNGASSSKHLRALIQTSPLPMGIQLEQRREDGERIKLAGRRKLRQAATERLADLFNVDCPDPNDECVQFRTPLTGGWMAATTLWFGRHEGLIDYQHAIVSEETFEAPGGPCPTVQLCKNISYCALLGIGSTEWLYLFDDEIEPAIELLSELCRMFMAKAPALLKGIEPRPIGGVS